MSLYNPRVKVYDFGTITANAAGNYFGSSAHPITGELVKIIVSGATTAATGSIFIQTNNIVGYQTQGSVIATNGNTETYFGVNQQRGAFISRPTVNDILYFSGAGFGNGSVITAQIYYY